MEASDTFREVMGQFVTGVSIVTTKRAGEPHGMTVNSFTSVSLDPQLVLFNADVSTNTHDFVETSGHFAVNILRESQSGLSNRFAGKHHEMDNPFYDIDLTEGGTGAPIIEDSIAYLDCSVHSSHREGDHTIYVGEVEEMGVWDGESRPLAFFRGQYGSIELSED